VLDTAVFGRQSADATQGHVNNVMYNRYAESARVNWTLNFAAMDPKHKKEWLELMSPKSIGLLLRSIKTDYKFVSTAAPSRKCAAGCLRMCCCVPLVNRGNQDDFADLLDYQAYEVA